MFRNTLTANDNYPVQDFGNLSSPIQMQFSFKPKFFSDFLVPFLEFTSNFEILKKQMIAISPFFRKLQNVKNMVRPLSKKHRSRTPFDSQHDKGSPTLAKSASDRFDQIFSSLRETLIWKTSPLLNN